MLLCFTEMKCSIQHTASLPDSLKLQQVKLLSTLSRGILKINASQTSFPILSLGKQMKFSTYPGGTSRSVPSICLFYCESYKPDLGKLQQGLGEYSFSLYPSTSTISRRFLYLLITFIINSSNMNIICKLLQSKSLTQTSSVNTNCTLFDCWINRLLQYLLLIEFLLQGRMETLIAISEYQARL